MRKASDCPDLDYFTGYVDCWNDMSEALKGEDMRLGVALSLFKLKEEAEEELGKLLEKMHEDYEKDREELDKETAKEYNCTDAPTLGA